MLQWKTDFELISSNYGFILPNRHSHFDGGCVQARALSDMKAITQCHFNGVLELEYLKKPCQKSMFLKIVNNY